jgi:hypothetical protein
MLPECRPVASIPAAAASSLLIAGVLLSLAFLIAKTLLGLFYCCSRWFPGLCWPLAVLVYDYAIQALDVDGIPAFDCFLAFVGNL